MQGKNRDMSNILNQFAFVMENHESTVSNSVTNIYSTVCIPFGKNKGMNQEKMVHRKTFQKYHSSNFSIKKPSR